MNPMLQDWAMIAHPPLLFLGYAGLTVPFAVAMGALVAGRGDNLWVARARRWTLASWLFLTAGIVLGAEWAYVELGWGGYWAWDPVENASLLPWFTATALMHSLILHQRRGIFKTWSASLAALSLILCVFGTYLTRSGIISSVHAFPESEIGWYFLGVLAVLLVGSVAVMLWRRRLLKGERHMERLISMDGAFLGANLLLVIMMLTTLIGTIFPVLSRLFTDHPVTLGSPFYNKVVVPMALILVALMATGPLLALIGNAPRLRRRLIIPGIAAHAGGLAGFVLGGGNVWMAAIAAISAFAVLTLCEDFVRSILRPMRAPDQKAAAMWRALGANAKRYGGQLVHLGIVMILMGVAGSSLYSAKEDCDLTSGQAVGIGRYKLRLESLDEVQGDNYAAREAKLTLFTPGGGRTALRPQRRWYNKSKQANSEVAVYMSLREDVYVILAGWIDHGRITKIQAIINPLVCWIWIGGITMSIGSLICLSAGRRKGQPLPRTEGDEAAGRTAPVEVI